MPLDWNENDWIEDEFHRPTMSQHLSHDCKKSVTLAKQLSFLDMIKRENRHVDWSIWGPLLGKGWK